MNDDREDYDREMMIEAMQAARGESLPRNPPPGPKWQAKEGLQRLLKGAGCAATMWLLIDYANGKTGLCYPSEVRLAAVLDVVTRTIERHVATLKKIGLVRVIPRCDDKGATSNLYIINWSPLFAACRQMHVAKRRSKQNVSGTPPSNVSAKPREYEPREGNLGHEMVADATTRHDGFEEASPKPAAPARPSKPYVPPPPATEHELRASGLSEEGIARYLASQAAKAAAERPALNEWETQWPDSQRSKAKCKT